MNKLLLTLAAMCCTLALSATNYTCHLKVTVNETVSEQDEVPVEVVGNNGIYLDSQELRTRCRRHPFACGQHRGIGY